MDDADNVQASAWTGCVIPTRDILAYSAEMEDYTQLAHLRL